MFLTSDEMVINGTDEEIKGVKVKDKARNNISFIYRRRDRRLYRQLIE